MGASTGGFNDLFPGVRGRARRLRGRPGTGTIGRFAPSLPGSVSRARQHRAASHGSIHALKLSQLLDEAAVLLDLDGRDKWQAIEALTDRLVAARCVRAEHRAPVLAAVLAREKSMSTGMENGIAIPHTSVAEVAKPAVALGVSRAGIDFQAIDGRPTHLVILLVNPAQQTKDHIRTLAEIARLLSSAELRSALVRAGDAGEILQTIRAAEAVTT